MSVKISQIYMSSLDIGILAYISSCSDLLVVPPAFSHELINGFTQTICILDTTSVGYKRFLRQLAFTQTIACTSFTFIVYTFKQTTFYTNQLLHFTLSSFTPQLRRASHKSRCAPGEWAVSGKGLGTCFAKSNGRRFLIWFLYFLTLISLVAFCIRDWSDLRKGVQEVDPKLYWCLFSHLTTHISTIL